MAASDNAAEFDTWISREIEEAADALAGEWLDELSQALGVRSRRLLPTDELRDHIPQVIRGVGGFVAAPVEPVKSDVIDRLRLLAELRREQGYDVEELLIEFETLSKLLSAHFVELVEQYPGEARPRQVAETSARMREALAAITRVTVGAYRQEEAEHKQELARRLSDYTRTIAHELKNPLNAATAGAQMLQRGDLTEDKYARFLDLVVQSLSRIDDLIDDISALAVEESARAEPRWIPLGQAVERVFEEVRERATAGGVALEIDRELPPIKVDAARVEIALMNLVGNAIKYADPEKEERWVRVGAEAAEKGGRTEGGWVIRVADNGLGIPRDLQNKVFQRHFRAHPHVAEGTGLGLSITHYIVTQRGGSIDFESTEGEGSTFYVTIPERQERPEEHGGKRQP